MTLARDDEVKAERSPIVLLSDFGYGEYVGVMKGVIYGIDRGAVVVDLCHEVAPQNVLEGAWILQNAYRYFPEGSVFCGVVDPGVGTERRALAVRTARYYFVSPDNGLLDETLRSELVVEVRALATPEGASRTFHGRDVFASAAARIGRGQFEFLGRVVEGWQKLPIHQKGRAGTVVRVDRFGNVVTNLEPEEKAKYVVVAGGHYWEMPFRATYTAAREGELFLIEGSCGTLEISLKNGSANARLELRSGMTISIV